MGSVFVMHLIQNLETPEILRTHLDFAYPNAVEQNGEYFSIRR